MFVDNHWQTIQGENRLISWSKTALTDTDGRVSHVISTGIDVTEHRRAEKEKETLIGELRYALGRVNELGGLLPVCTHCKMVRDDKGYWRQLEAFIHQHSSEDISQSICPDCARKLYPDIDIQDD